MANSLFSGGLARGVSAVWRRLLVFVKRVLLAVAAVAVGVFAVSLICYGRVNALGRPVSYSGTEGLEQLSYVLVPGTAIYGSQPSPELEARLRRALELYEAGLADKILISGGYYEAEVMRSYMLRIGLPYEKLLVDPYGEDTFDSITRAAAALPGQRFYFVTQHAYADRAAYLIDRTGASGTCITADHAGTSPSRKQAAREYLAATKAVLDAEILKREPKYALSQWPVEG